MTLVIFSRYFFERKVFEGWLDRMAAISFVLIAIPNIAFALLAPAGSSCSTRRCCWASWSC